MIETGMILRPYQELAKEAILNSWKTVDKSLLVLPTGTGKTIVFCKLSEILVAEGKRVLIIAHRGELLEQAADKMQIATGLGCAIEKADNSAIGSWFRITVGSIQSLMRPKRLEQFEPDYYDAIIVDEAHHVLADSYQRVLGHFENAKVLGVTATPDRGDMRDLGEYFENLAYEYSLSQAIRDGYLCKIQAVTIPLNIDLNGVKTQAGDFQLKALGSALDPYLEQIAEEMANYCRDRKTVVFLPLIATSQKMRDFLKAKGFDAVEVNGKSKDRKRILRGFEKSKGGVLCNSMLLTEGWDCPPVDCIVCLRPTKMRSLYSQIVGRGTRIHPGKENLLLLDFLWHSDRHELSHPAHLICESEDVANKMVENAANCAGEPQDIEEAEQQAESDCVCERETALAKMLEGMRKRKRKLVDPLQFEMSIQAEDLANYKPAFGWEMEPPSDKQKGTLEKLGILPDAVDTAGKATKLLDRLDKRRDEGLTTPKQIRFLERMGFRHVGQWPFEGASKMINRVAACRWRVPQGVNAKEYKPEGETI